jgi:transcription elongation GreA/GreB family factor
MVAGLHLVRRVLVIQPPTSRSAGFSKQHPQGPPAPRLERLKRARGLHGHTVAHGESSPWQRQGPSTRLRLRKGHLVAPASAPRNGRCPQPQRGRGPDVALDATKYVEFEPELDHLRGIRVRCPLERLREARGFLGADAVEEIARRQGEDAVIDARIARLDGLPHSAPLIPDGRDGSVATPGRTVEIEYERSGRRASYLLGGIAPGADGRPGSARSAVGQALKDRRAGCLVSVELPAGRVERPQIVAIVPPVGKVS